MESKKQELNVELVPLRPYGDTKDECRLAKKLPIIGLGCSSFSTFFWDASELAQESSAKWTPEGMNPNHPRVREWISTIRYAIETCGIYLLDTAPWYGHGTSEVVIGWAMEQLLAAGSVTRDELVINTKVGRYEADPKKQFDFSYEATMASVQRSLERMKCQYIDVLQLHDPEFCPSLDILLKETIPALLECRSKKYCKALGITGYPLSVQYQIMQLSLELDPKSGKIWDQSLTYGHYNLVDTSLLDQPIGSAASFGEYCEKHEIGLMAAAPLNMGLLTNNMLSDWHPASNDLKDACRQAATICKDEGINIVTLALVFALSNPRVPCTILGMKDKSEVKFAHSIASRFHVLSEETTNQEDVLKKVLSETEYKVLMKVRDHKNGPFAKVWNSGAFAWDGIAEARKFWKGLEGSTQPDWQLE